MYSYSLGICYLFTSENSALTFSQNTLLALSGSGCFVSWMQHSLKLRISRAFWSQGQWRSLKFTRVVTPLTTTTTTTFFSSKRCIIKAEYVYRPLKVVFRAENLAKACLGVQLWKGNTSATAPLLIVPLQWNLRQVICMKIIVLQRFLLLFLLGNNPETLRSLQPQQY